MCSVYRNPFCNLPATGASFPTEGFLIESTDEVFRISADWEGTYSKSDRTEFYHFDQQEWEQNIPNSPSPQASMTLAREIIGSPDASLWSFSSCLGVQ